MLEGLGSGVPVAVRAVLVITVPEAVAAATVTIRVKVVVPPGGNDAIVHLIEAPGAGQTHAVPV